MPKIKWLGIISGDIAEYKKGSLPEAAQRLDMPDTMGSMMIRALPFLSVPLIIIFLSMFIKTYISGQRVLEPLFFVLGLITGFLLMILHEFLHALAYPAGAEVYIGLYPKAFAAVALASYPLGKVRFIVMCLLPALLGLVPVVIFWLLPASAVRINGFVFGLAAFGLVSPYTDYYNVYQVIRQTPMSCKIQFYGNDTYWFR